MEKNNKTPTPILSTILLALFMSVLCMVSVVIYLVLNWQNPIWTAQIKLLFSAVVVVLLGVMVLLMILYRKIIR